MIPEKIPPPANVSLQVIGPKNVVLIPELFEWRDFRPALSIFAEGVETFADVMDRDVAAFLLDGEQLTIAFQRITSPQSPVAAEYLARGWKVLGYLAVRVYSSLTEYQASPG
jgi:hypothetical protein